MHDRRRCVVVQARIATFSWRKRVLYCTNLRCESWCGTRRCAQVFGRTHYDEGVDDVVGVAQTWKPGVGSTTVVMPRGVCTRCNNIPQPPAPRMRAGVYDREVDSGG